MTPKILDFCNALCKSMFNVNFSVFYKDGYIKQIYFFESVPIQGNYLFLLEEDNFKVKVWFGKKAKVSGSSVYYLNEVCKALNEYYEEVLNNVKRN